MIEKASAVDDLESLLAVKGVDMVQFGPADYSISIGKPGQVRDTVVQKAHQTMIEMALKKGVAPRVEMASFEQAKPFAEMGVRHYCIGWDTGIMFQWCRQQGQGMRDLLASK